MLADLRASVTNALEAAGITAVDYASDTLRPPVAAVVPGQPYIERRPADAKTAFAKPMAVRLDVLVLVAREGSARAESRAVDRQIEQAVAAIPSSWRLRRVSQPGVVQVQRGTKSIALVGAVVQIEQDTTEMSGD